MSNLANRQFHFGLLLIHFQSQGRTKIIDEFCNDTSKSLEIESRMNNRVSFAPPNRHSGRMTMRGANRRESMTNSRRSGPSLRMIKLKLLLGCYEYCKEAKI